MEKIRIENFGPIKEIELKIKPFIVFIGPQASGKSTISKTIYFFKSLRNDVLKYFIEVIESGDFEKPLGKVGKILRKKFLDFFGPTSDKHYFKLHYDFGNNKTITIDLKGKYVNPIFNENFKKEFREILLKIKNELSPYFQRNHKFLSASELLKLEEKKNQVIHKIEEMVNNLFEDDKDLLFIPAGRSLLTILSDQLQYIDPYKLDYLMEAFINRINSTKPLFNKSLQELISDKKYLTTEAINFKFVYKAKKVIENILKATYRNDSSGEKLFVSKDKYVKINYSSSGQQEAIWILNLIFISLLNNNKLFVVFEEPEAHLYPEAQKEIVDLIALLFNGLNSQIIITTHSPYILSSLNNLLYAGKLRKKGINISKFIDNTLIIDYEKFSSFFVEDGTIKDILDQETKLIKNETIDNASEIINTIFENLFNLDIP